VSFKDRLLSVIVINRKGQNCNRDELVRGRP
jgi:hypothetical protein